MRRLMVSVHRRLRASHRQFDVADEAKSEAIGRIEIYGPVEPLQGCSGLRFVEEDLSPGHIEAGVVRGQGGRLCVSLMGR